MKPNKFVRRLKLQQLFRCMIDRNSGTSYMRDKMYRVKITK